MKSLTISALIGATVLCASTFASADIYDDAVSNPARPEADRARDAREPLNNSVASLAIRQTRG